jgi:NAD(P)-dependent dehydrogenase (short-subunit alcohol dehydrogenase family)
VDAVERAVLADRQVRRTDACVDVVASANVAELCLLALDDMRASGQPLLAIALRHERLCRSQATALASRASQGCCAVVSSLRDGRSQRSTERTRMSTAPSRSGATSPTAAVAAAIERVVAEPGAPKAVVNAAGVYPPSTLQTATTERYRRTFDVNMLGTLLVTQAVAPSLVEGAAVVNFASIDAFVPSPG